jgi:GNAT superfamily N-acetyltransferase
VVRPAACHNEGVRHEPAARVPSALEMRTIRFEEVGAILDLIRRAVERGCRQYYDSAQRAGVFGVYAQSLFVESLGPFDSVTALAGDRLVGFAQLDPASARLRALFVDAELQQRGVGRALLAEIERRALARGLQRLHGAMSLNAVTFYSRAGFRPYPGPERLVAAGVTVPVVRMEKTLRTLTPA